MIQSRQNESGRTMLEMLGVLAIMGVIMYGAIAGINFGVTMYKINKTYNDIEELSEGVVDLFSWSRSYPTAAEWPAVRLGENNVIDASGEFNVFEGAFGAITVGNPGNCDDSCFTITVVTPGEFECTRLKNMTYAYMNPDNASCSGGSTVYLISR